VKRERLAVGRHLVGARPNLVGRGSRKTETFSQGDWSSPDEGTSLDPRRAEPWCSAMPRLGMFIDLAVPSHWCPSIFSGETSRSFRSLAPPS
jgi:hypothetical protein